jgi:hypothetical protein
MAHRALLVAVGEVQCLFVELEQEGGEVGVVGDVSGPRDACVAAEDIVMLALHNRQRRSLAITVRVEIVRLVALDRPSHK